MSGAVAASKRRSPGRWYDPAYPRCGRGRLPVTALVPVVLVIIAGCSLIQSQSAAQRFYEAQSAYNLAARVAVEYMTSSAATPAARSVIRQIDARAFPVIESGNAAARRPATNERNKTLMIAAKTLDAAAKELRDYLDSTRGVLP